MSAVTPEAVDAAAKVLMRGGNVQAMLEAAAPMIVLAVFGDGTGPAGPGDVTAAAKVLGDAGDGQSHQDLAGAVLRAVAPRIRAAERARCATVLANVPPLDFLAAHGLEPGAAPGRVLVAAAAHILAPGGDGPGRTGGGE